MSALTIEPERYELTAAPLYHFELEAATGKRLRSLLFWPNHAS